MEKRRISYRLLGLMSFTSGDRGVTNDEYKERLKSREVTAEEYLELVDTFLEAWEMLGENFESAETRTEKLSIIEQGESLLFEMDEFLREELGEDLTSNEKAADLDRLEGAAEHLVRLREGLGERWKNIE